MRIICPNCGLNNIMNIEYGNPDEAMIRRIEAGEILHGGCAIDGLMQNYYCLDCDTRFDLTSSQHFLESITSISVSVGRLHYDIRIQDSVVLINGLKINLDKTLFLNEISIFGLEFWNHTQSHHPDVHIECPTYFMDHIDVDFDVHIPYHFEAFRIYLEYLKENAS